MKKYFFLLLIALVSSCTTTKNKSKEINIYSQRHYNVDELQYQNFEKMTGIKVNVTKANADELIQRLKNEGENSPADLFITVDVGKLWQASDMGLFQ
ncbi:MAG: Fe(3+) ABC transporter substrate-binding protein, partial [Bacteroidota bacterium]|nr:Fe(3+) ABC transporter substrate-binding protein [Bacteroidota bacterium]